MIRRFIILALAVALLGHIGYLYVKVVRGVAKDTWETPSIIYGRPTAIRKGDHLGNLRFAEHLQKLSYKRVTGKPKDSGTYTRDSSRIRIFLRDNGIDNPSQVSSPVEIGIQDGRVASLISADGMPLELIHLEAQEIGRIMGPNMESRKPVPLSDISPHLQNAVIATEDVRFYNHIGIDFFSIGRALYTNIKALRFAQGGSTITQQLAKNLFLSPRKTLWRKLIEAELAIMLELRYTKKQILEMYLNKIYFGQEGLAGIFGIEEAAGSYFSKKAKDLSLDESALLAAIICSPNRYSLLKNPAKAKNRRNAVLKRMRQLNMIQQDEFALASNAPIMIRPRSGPAHLVSYFADYMQRIAADSLGNEKLYRTGYRYYTTIDPIHQAAAQEAVNAGLQEIEKMARPTSESLQAALVTIDPRTGEMTAMIGGRDYGKSQFNRAADARRQAGSTFKPFVLLTALSLTAQDKGDWTLSTIVSGESISIPTPKEMWTPANFEGKTYGDITIRKMIENSVNTAAVRLASEIGLEEIIKIARASGITSPLLPVPSMPLGTFEVTPLELAYAYATIASGGIRYIPSAVSSVATEDGDIIMTNKVQQENVIDTRTAYLTGYALEGVLERGTAASAKAMGINFPASGKTGTTDGNRDSWFVGFTPDIVCAVWVGCDSGADTGLTGSSGALRIWARFIRSLYPHAAPSSTLPPDGLETAVIDPESGYLATTLCPQTFSEAYLAGTAPTETCPLHPVNPVADAVRSGMQSIRNFFRNIFK
ncbi:MAG: PBP1A family penicillin-binding protein [Syntrophaceae bacterium]|nr:PBP1A family penicillin-binding protein [Syntrophaceae bacterium]